MRYWRHPRRPSPFQRGWGRAVGLCVALWGVVCLCSERLSSKHLAAISCAASEKSGAESIPTPQPPQPPSSETAKTQLSAPKQQRLKAPRGGAGLGLQRTPGGGLRGAHGGRRPRRRAAAAAAAAFFQVFAVFGPCDQQA